MKTGKALTVPQSSDQEGQELTLTKKSFTLNQKWKVIYVEDAEALKTTGLYHAMGLHLGRPFIIRSRMPMQRVLTVVGGRNVAIMTHDRTKETQIWFLDARSKSIKNVKHNSQSLDIQNSGTSTNLQIWNTNARWWQLFGYKDGYMTDIKDNRVFDVAANRDAEGQNVILFKKHGGLNQQWDIVYLDEMPPPLSSGDFHPDYGMYCNREFSVVSKEGSGKYIDVIGSNLALKTRSDSKSQKWMFELATRTIINADSGLSWDIQGEGKHW